MLAYGREFDDVFVRGAERRESDLLREFREALVRKQRYVTKQFVHTISAI